MRLKIENLSNPVVEKTTNSNISANGAIIYTSFEPNPKFQLSTQASGTVIYEPQANDTPKFSVPDGTEWDPSILLAELETWYIITAFIAAEHYLAEAISYRPQLVKYFLKALAPVKR